MTFHRFHHHGWLLLSVVVFASCLVEASEPSSRNLVQNGGFETPHPDDFLQPDQWADFQTSSRTAYRDRRTFHRGSVSLKLLTDPAAGTQQMYQRLHGVEAGDVLRVSFWAKTNGQVYGQVALLSGTIREAPQLLAEKSFRDGGWQPYTFTVTVPAGLTAPLAIHLGHANGKVAGGIVWFDDVTVVKTGRVPNPPRRVPKELVSNGGFEEVQNRGGHGGQPIEWTVRNLNPKEEKSVTFEVVAPGRSGARCVKIAGASADSFVALSQEVQGVNPGGWFVLRLAYRAEGEVKGGAMIVGLDERGNDVQLSIAGDFVPSREWRTMEHQFQLSPDAKSAQIVINVVGTSAVYVDDVSLTAGKLPSPAVARQPRLYPLPPLADIKTHTLQGRFWQGQFHNGVPQGLTFTGSNAPTLLVQRVGFGWEAAGKVQAPTAGEMGFDVVRSYYKRYRANLRFGGVHTLQVFTESVSDSPFLYLSPRWTLGREVSDQTLLVRFTLAGALDTATWFSDGVMRTQAVSAFGGAAVHVSRERPVMLFYHRASQQGLLVYFPLPAPELREWFVEDYRVKATPTLMATVASNPKQTDVTFRIGPFGGAAGDTVDFYFVLMGFAGTPSDALRAVHVDGVWEERIVGVGGEPIVIEQLGITQGGKTVKQRAGILPPRAVYRLDFQLDDTEKTQCTIAAYLLHDRRVDARPALRVAVNGQPLTDQTPPLNADATYKVSDEELPLYDAQKAAWTLRRERSINGQLDEQHPLYSPELAQMGHRLIFDVSALVKKGENFITVENVGDAPLVLPATPSSWRYFPVEGYSGRVEVEYPNLHADGFAWGLPRWSCDHVMATLERLADLTGKPFWRDAALRHFVYYLEKSNEQGLVPERITRDRTSPPPLLGKEGKGEVYFVPGLGHNDLWFALRFLPRLPAPEREADYRLLQRLRTLYDPQNPNGWVTLRADGSFWFEPRQFANDTGEPPYIVSSHCAALRVAATMLRLSQVLGQEQDAQFWQTVTRRGVDALVWYLGQTKAWDADDQDGDALALSLHMPEPRASGNAHLECLRHLIQVMTLTDYRRRDLLPHVRKMAQHVIKNNADAHGEEDLDFATTLYPFAARFDPSLFKAIDAAYRQGLDQARILNWSGAGVPDAQPALPLAIESSPDLPLPCSAAWNVVVLENLTAQDQTVTIKVADEVKVESAQELVAHDRLTVEGQTLRCIVPAGRVRAVRIDVKGH